MPRLKEKIGIIGCGVMGQTLIKGLLSGNVVSRGQLWGGARTQKTCQKVKKELGVSVFVHYKKELSKTDVILVCVKPPQVKEVLRNLKNKGLKPQTLIVSIVAGVPIKTLEKILNSKNPVIRSMPNTPCLVREGMTVICPGSFVKTSQVSVAEHIFESVGKCLVLEENHFNAVTALSGSGPAYHYLIMEALADGGVRVGLPRNIALALVTQTVLGAARMVQETGRHPASLREDVTTPSGCTIGALMTLEDGKIRSVLAKAVEEATRIAAGLGEKG